MKCSTSHTSEKLVILAFAKAQDASYSKLLQSENNTFLLSSSTS
ncbi:MAG: hypothetical protein AAB316_17420 [Bacteroidota bacterium]